MSIRRLVGSGFPSPESRNPADATLRPGPGPEGGRAWAISVALAAALGAVVVCLVWRAHGAGAGFGVAGWVLLAVFALYASWRVRVRADNLRSVCRDFAERRYDRRAALPGGGALSGLADDLNALGERLHAAHDELARSRGLLDAALGALSEGVACLDRLDRVLYANPAYRQLVAGGADVDGRPYYEHMPAAELSVPVAAARRGEDPGPGLDFEHGRRLLRGRVASSDDVLVLVLHDLTDLKRLEAARRDFMAAVSHELKTPLTSILGFTETLLDGDVDPVTSRSFIEKIGRHADRLASLVKDVLTLSRLEQGAWQARPEHVDLVQVGRTVLDEFQATADLARVSLVLDAKEPVELVVDPELARMLIGNLVSNAVRYNRPEGTVWLRLAADVRGAVVTVQDTGIGISSEHRERIFERFYRVDSHRSRQTGGTGLGLAIVKHLLQVLGGTIALHSDAGGTRFDLRLPVVELDDDRP